MKIAFFYYDRFAEFEIALSWFVLSGKHTLIATALEARSYASMEGQRFLIDKPLNELDPMEIGMLVIPGGVPAPIRNNPQLKKFIGTILEHGGTVAGICGGSELLASCGFLDGRECTGEGTGVEETDDSFPLYAKAKLTDRHVVVDGNVITAQGQAHAEFAVELGLKSGTFTTSEDAHGMLQWLKNIR